jgi:hemolysin activation/secretion protein
LAGVTATLLLLLSTALAQTPSTDIPAAPRFEIARFAVEGNTLLTQQEIDRAVAPHVGANKDFGDI